MAIDLCETGREADIKEQRAWIAKQKYVVDRIKAVETTLGDRQKLIDDLKETIRQEQEQKEQAILQERAVSLIGYGMSFVDNAYVLDELHISVVQVKSADDFTWNALKAAVETRWKEKQAQEILRKEEEEKELARQRAVREEQLLKEEALRKKEEALAAREKAIADAEAKAKADEERRIKEKEEAELAAITAKNKARESALFQLGFALQGDAFIFEPNRFLREQIFSISDKDWPACLEGITVAVNFEKNRR
jgi:hypothetical protein